ncbi:transposable element Tcb2 transposase [Trichonephila clavipes]|nr:transposable element Tcb2 transposase [Trichonephila clavipes]
MFIVFFDAVGIFHHEYAPQGQKVNTEFYLDVMRRLREAVRRKRPVFLPGNGRRKLYMQIKVHDVKNQKKEIRAEIGMVQKRLFYCRNCEIRLRSDWNPGKHKVVSRTLLESPEVEARLWNRFQETGNVRRGPGAGRPRATTSTDDRYIQLTTHRNRTENATQLQRQLLLTRGRKVSSQTVRNRLHEGGLYARRPMVCIPLTPRHCAARKSWDAEHRDWEKHDWSQVLFTDESRFSLECDIRRVFVWRDRGTQSNPAFVRERSQYRRSGWMVWGGISIGGRTDLHIIRNGTLMGRRYADEILRPHIIPYAGAIGDSFVFQEDNARPHRACLLENMLEAETIQRMEWPACSSDLNLIEHVWDMLGRFIATRPRPPATVRDLEIALLEEWNSIPQKV